MNNTDQLATRYAAEIEEKQAFIDGIVEAAEKDGRDLSAQEMELVTRSRDRMSELAPQLETLKETRRIALDSRRQLEDVGKLFGNGDSKPVEVQFRSVGEYVLERWKAGIGSREATERLDLFHRAAAHQLTSDNPGLLPEQILGPIISFVDAVRPLVTALGPRQLPSGSWARPRITQHTDVAEQTAEKTELVSRKMTIGKVPVTATTYGGYVNVSRQNIDWSQPGIMDIVINDLAAQYALETELATGTDLTAAATSGPSIPAAPTAADVAAAVWAAAGQVYTATKGQGRLILACSPDMLGLIGPLFAPVNPQNAQSTGFTAGTFGQGALGAISGITVVVSAGLATGTILVLSTAAAEVYEDRIGALQVVEPSVLGVQVAYAGYFADIVLEPTGVVKVVQAGP